jgi:copper(I)-binding protein
MRVLIMLMAIFIAIAPTRARADAGGISVDGVWCQISTERAGTAYVYLTISVEGKGVDRLIGAASPIARRVDILTLQKRHGQQQLLPAPGIEVTSHEPTVLQPFEPHLILRGVHKRLVHGDTFPLTLTFEKAGAREVSAKVLSRAPAEGMPNLPKGVKLD